MSDPKREGTGGYRAEAEVLRKIAGTMAGDPEALGELPSLVEHFQRSISFINRNRMVHALLADLEGSE